MRVNLILVFILIALPLFSQAQQTDSSKAPKMVFEKSTHDFGKIVEGSVVTYTFRFTNKGTDTLKLTGGISSCGCIAVTADTTKKYPPGASGVVKVAFNTKGKSGPVNKEVGVFSNEKNYARLFVKAYVIAKQ